MAVRTPTTIGNVGYVGDDAVFGGVVAVTETFLANGTRYSREASATANRIRRGDLALVIEYFDDVDEADTYASGLGADLVAVAWQSNNPDETNPLNVTITGADGTVTWDGPSGNASAGWLWCLVRRNGNRGSEIG